VVRSSEILQLVDYAIQHLQDDGVGEVLKFFYVHQEEPLETCKNMTMWQLVFDRLPAMFQFEKALSTFTLLTLARLWRPWCRLWSVVRATGLQHPRQRI
jgi:hypothetical protein